MTVIGNSPSQPRRTGGATWSQLSCQIDGIAYKVMFDLDAFQSVTERGTGLFGGREDRDDVVGECYFQADPQIDDGRPA